MAGLPSSYDDSVALATTIRNILGDKEMLNNIIMMLPEDKRPPYWDAISQKDGLTAAVTAQMLKAVMGDVTAAGWLAKYGWGDKIQVDTSGFFSTTKLEIKVINPEALPDSLTQEGEIVEAINDTTEQ